MADDTATLGGAEHVSAAAGQRGAPSSAVTEEEAYRVFAASLPDTTLFVFGPDLRYRMVAGAGISRFRWRREDIVGRRPSELLPGGDGADLEDEMRRVLRGDIRRYEHRGIHDPGVHWSSTLTPIRDADGAVAAGMVISREVSSAGEAERARRQAEERFAVALAAAPVFVFAQDEELRYTWANKTFAHGSSEEVLGLTDEDILPPEAAAASRAAKRTVLETGAGTRLLLEVDAAGGSRYYEMTIEPARDQAGAVAGIVGAALDVSELKASEQRLRAALEATLDAVTIQEPVRDGDGRIVDFRITYATTGAVDHTGRGFDELVGNTILSLYPSLADTGFVDGCVEILRTGTPLQMTALPYGEGKATRYYDLSAGHLSDHELLVVWRDVTDREAQRRTGARAEAIRALAEQLQRGLLPAALPEVPGLSFSVAYRPANATAEVGGDWYDAFLLPDAESLIVVVGDVEGHDGEAAGLMCRISSVIRAEASHGASPPAVLELAERFLLDLGVERMVTVAVARVDSRTGEVTLASAGHPPPLVADGATTSLVPIEVGPPLGAGPAPRQASRFVLPPAGTLLLYTDGLCCPQIPADEAISRLADCLAEGAARPLDEVVDELIRRTVAFQPSDDVAVVAMRRSR